MKFELYGKDVELEFDEKKHVYRVEGAIVPSVTGITSIIDKSGPLMWWAVGQCLEYVEKRLGDTATGFASNTWQDEIERKSFLHDAHRAHLRASKQATDLGSLAHEWIDLFLQGEDPPMPRNEKLRATIKSWIEWAEQQHIEPYETEFKVYSREHRYAGTCDFDGMVGEERCIVDWKTGKGKVYPEHRLQTAAYLYAREEELGCKYDARYVVVLPKDGGDITVERLDNEWLDWDMDGFLGAMALRKATLRRL